MISETVKMAALIDPFRHCTFTANIKQNIKKCFKTVTKKIDLPPKKKEKKKKKANKDA